jgi:cysteine desulfuration protein SufE
MAAAGGVADGRAADMTELGQAQEELVAEFELFDNWMDRYQYIIDLGRNLPEFPADWRTEEYRIRGCQSQVWLRTMPRDGRLEFQAISDSAIVSGLIAILMRVYSGKEARDIAVATPAFVGAIGLDEHLSPTRSNGLNAMIAAIRQAAQDCVTA